MHPLRMVVAMDTLWLRLPESCVQQSNSIIAHDNKMVCASQAHCRRFPPSLSIHQREISTDSRAQSFLLDAEEAGAAPLLLKG